MRAHLTYANVTATLALALAVGGGSAVAATMITGRDVVDGSIQAQDLSRGVLATPLKLRPGQTIRGGAVVDSHAQDAGEDHATFVPLGARSTKRIDTPDVEVVDPDKPGQRGVACKGSENLPTAPRGMLCFYVTRSKNAGTPELAQLNGLRAVEDRGFSVGIESKAAGDVYVTAVWAYTAP